MLVKRNYKKEVELTLLTHTYTQLLMAGYDIVFGKTGALNQPEHHNMFYRTALKIESESKPDDVLTLIYTSGTTGVPKGVILTHTNVLWTGYGFANRRISRDAYPKNSLGKKMTNRQDFAISYLPLAHIYMRALQAAMVMLHGCLGFW